MKKLLILPILALSLLANDRVKIAIDIGHTPKRFGAVSSTGVKEYEYNYKLVSTLRDYLKKAYGFRAFVINSAKEEISLKDRVDIAQKERAKLLLSIHHDSVKEQFLKERIVHHQKVFFTNDKRFSGYSIFVSKKNPHFKESLEIAKAIGKSLRRAGFKVASYHSDDIKGERKEFLVPELGIYRYDNLVILKYASSPAILIEVGVIVNPKEEKRLSSREFREKFSRAVILGLKSYFID